MLSMITSAEANAAEAAQRPLAGSGAGAFMCEGTWTEPRATRKAASPALPRIRRPGGVSGQGYAQAGSASRAYPATFGQVSPVLAGAALTSPALTSAVKFGGGLNGVTQHLNQTTRIPVIPGGLGPHPAREPDPV